MEECLNIGAIDDILNFNDLGDDDDEHNPRTKGLPLTTSPHAAFLEEQEQEEELEWISNFPPVDEYVLAGNKHQSPVSVLENSTSSSNNSNSNSSSNNSNSFIMSCCGSLRVPVRARNKRCRKRRRSFADLPGQQFWWSQENVKNCRPPIKTTMIGRKCQHCGAEKTPQWRAGPLGSKTLCNACGVRFKSGRLVPEYRPASSPTFSSHLHSNSHRKIIEMRRQKQWQTAPVKAADKG